MQHQLSINKTAFYQSLGNFSSSTKYVWFVLHGFGQLSRYFSKKFEGAADSEHYFVFPEATHRYYLQGFQGRVGATWMTSDRREYDIEDNIAYLNKLYETEFLSRNNPELKLVVLGFSQGLATAMRWMFAEKIKVESLIMWAGSYPHETDFAALKDYFLQMKIFAVFGDADQYFNQEIIDEKLKPIKESNVQIECVSFSGGHDIDLKTLVDLKNKISQSHER